MCESTEAATALGNVIHHPNLDGVHGSASDECLQHACSAARDGRHCGGRQRGVVIELALKFLDGWSEWLWNGSEWRG